MFICYDIIWKGRARRRQTVHEMYSIKSFLFDLCSFFYFDRLNWKHNFFQFKHQYTTVFHSAYFFNN